MSISRRDALTGATVAVAVATVPIAVAAQAALAGGEARVLAMFRQLNPARQEISLMTLQTFLDVQRANESNGWAEEPPRPTYPGEARPT